MLKLYRGIIDILTARCEGLNDAFAKHIRAFNNGETEQNNFGVKGFWNLLLEITYVMYVKIFVGLGIVLTIFLAVVFFPLYALTIATMNVLNHKATPFEPEYIEPTQEKK
jgi:preprotein translocase subunit SecG